MTPEGRVKHEIDERLKSAHAYQHKPVQNGMGKPTLDYHVCHKGLYAGVEAKAPGKKATPRQIRTMKEMASSGASVFLIDEVTGFDMGQLAAWLLSPVAAFISKSAYPYITGADPVAGEDDELSND